jgi:hypothetical protein
LLAIIRPRVLPKLHKKNILKNQRRLLERHTMFRRIRRSLPQKPTELIILIKTNQRSFYCLAVIQPTSD